VHLPAPRTVAIQVEDDHVNPEKLPDYLDAGEPNLAHPTAMTRYGVSRPSIASSRDEPPNYEVALGNMKKLAFIKAPYNANFF